MYTRARAGRPAPLRHTRQEHRDGMNRHARSQADRLFSRVYRRAKGRFHTVSRCPNLIVDRTQNGLLVRRKVDGAPGPNRPPSLIEWSHVLAAIDLLVMDGMIGRRELMEETSVRDTSAVMGLLYSFGEGIQVVVLVKRKTYLRRVEVQVYLSGLEKNPTEMGLIDQVGGFRVLYSFAAIGDWVRGRGGGPPKWLASARQYGFSLLLDSGAFGFMRKAEDARKKGATLRLDWNEVLDRYCQLIERWGLRRYFALDVIGDWSLTKQLLIAMHKRGLRPVPVFHLGDPWEALDWLVNALGAPVIALGGAAKAPEGERTRWLDEVFRRYPSDRQMYHGCGFASLDTAARYPFLSVDASTAFSAGSKGELLSDVGRIKSDLPRLERMRHNFEWMVSLERRSAYSEFQLQFPFHSESPNQLVS